MSENVKPVVAIICDWDGTLAPLDQWASPMWRSAEEHSKEQQSSEVLAFMQMVAEKNGGKVTMADLEKHAKEMEFFPGVKDWVERTKTYAETKGVEVEFYIVTSGLREVAEKTEVGEKFNRVFGSSFAYDKDGVATGPAQVVDYTGKTQYITRISKGAHDLGDRTLVNAHIPMDQRRVPLSNMVYIGDGDTDVPCMKMVKDGGGTSIAVYGDKSASPGLANRLLEEGRVNLTAPADYREGSSIDHAIKTSIDQVAEAHQAHSRDGLLHQQSVSVVDQIASQIHPKSSEWGKASLAQLLDTKTREITRDSQGTLTAESIHFASNGKNGNITAYGLHHSRSAGDAWDGSKAAQKKFEQLSEGYFAANPDSDKALILIGKDKVLMSARTSDGKVQTQEMSAGEYLRFSQQGYGEIHNSKGEVEDVEESRFVYPQTLAQFQVNYDRRSKTFVQEQSFSSAPSQTSNGMDRGLQTTLLV